MEDANHGAGVTDCGCHNLINKPVGFPRIVDILAEVGKGGIYADGFDKFSAAILPCTVLRHSDVPWIPSPDINLMDL
jgi:hypothetical protein